MKFSGELDITPEEIHKLLGNPIYGWLNAVNDNVSVDDRSELGDSCANSTANKGEAENPSHSLTGAYSDMYKYTVVEAHKNMASFQNAFVTWCGANTESNK